jgi:8-oxo-dGTP pyrophosphatase MutT (NUDIX family)
MGHKDDTFYLGAKALIRNSEGKLLLLQCLPNDVFKDHRWDLPGGRVQKNESVEEALRRELYEEIGVKVIIRLSPFTMCRSAIRFPVQNGDVGLICAAYLCDIAAESSIHISDEYMRFEWLNRAKQPNS